MNSKSLPRILVVATTLGLVVAFASPAGGASTPGRAKVAPKAFLEARAARLAQPGPPSTLVADNFTVLGHSNLQGGAPTGDVFFFDHGGSVGKYAYLGSWAVPCAGTGVRIVDVNDPAHPKVVGIADSGLGVSSEDVVVARIGTRDVLVTGIQTCRRQGVPGLALFDVTDPSHPAGIGFLPTGPDGPHEVDVVVRADGLALAVFAVPFSEVVDFFEGTSFGGDFRIADISDPTNPVQVADWGVLADSSITIEAGNDELTSPFQGIGLFPVQFAHSARAADGGMTAYVSYWDSGVLKFDISDPANPVLLGSTDYPVDADGEAHSVVPYDAGGQRYLFQNDEDFDTPSPAIITSSATGSEEFAGVDEPWMPTLLLDTGPITAAVHDAGVGCQAADYAGAAGQIALADTLDPFYFEPPCSFGTQILLAADAGALAFVSNLSPPDDAYAFAPEEELGRIAAEAVGMPVVQISDIDDLAAAVRAVGSGATMTLTPTEPSWGFLRVFREGTTDADGDGVPDFEQVGSFSDLPHTTGELFTPPGAWSIHNTEINGTVAYSSWYSHGVIAFDLSDPTDPEMVGQFVPPTNPRHGSFLNRFLGMGPALVWGVAIDPETDVVYASDMRTGLWILEPTGPAAP